MTDNTVAKPWFREPWFWFLVAFPMASIIWCAFMITVALNTENAMVTDDYSKEGRGINMEIARDQKAADLGLHAELEFNDRQVSLQVDTRDGKADFPYLVLNLFHPTLSAQDRIIQLQSAGGGYYTGNLHEPIDGRWYLDIRGPSNEWRLKGETNLPSETALRLGTESEGRG